MYPAEVSAIWIPLNKMHKDIGFESSIITIEAWVKRSEIKSCENYICKWSSSHNCKWGRHTEKSVTCDMNYWSLVA